MNDKIRLAYILMLKPRMFGSHCAYKDKKISEDSISLLDKYSMHKKILAKNFKIATQGVKITSIFQDMIANNITIAQAVEKIKNLV